MLKADRMKPYDDEDAFAIVGYRLLAARMLALTMADLLSKEKHLVQAAQDWFDPVRGKDSRITMEDCICMIGRASQADAVRKIAFSGDVYKIEQYIQSLGTSSPKRTNADAERQQRVQSQVFTELQFAMR